MKQKLTRIIDNRLAINNFDKDTYYIVGSEIRARRMRLEMTLEALADGICSLSYLCKIENSKIEPNKAFLNELCERLELSTTQVNTLLSLREALERCNVDFLNNRCDYIDDYFEKGRDLDNYRYSIIRFIYFIYHKNLPVANKIYLDLLQISQTMREFDFVVFSIFSAYLQYYNFRFNEAIEILECLDKFKLDDTLEALKTICLFKASYAANKADAPIHYLKAKGILFDIGLYELIDEMRYIVCLYYIKNNNYYFLGKEIDSIRNFLFKNSLRLIKDFKDKNVSKIMDYSENDLSDFAKMLKYYVTDYDKFKADLSLYENDYYSYDYDYNYLLILASKLEERYPTILFNEIIPRVCNSDDTYIKYFVLREVANLGSGNKNRSLIRAYFLLFSCDNSFSEFDMEGDN